MSTSPITLDSSTLKPIGAAAPSSITLDKSTLKPIQGAPAPAKKGFFQGEPFIGSTGEALAQGMKEESSIESRKAAAEGAATGFALMVPGSAFGEAVATRSLAPLLPLLTSYLTAKFGYHIGKDVGGLVGQPEAGGVIGGTLGGIAGGMGYKPTTMSIRGLLLNLLKGGEEGETAAAAAVKGATATETAIPATAEKAVTPSTPTASINPLSVQKYTKAQMLAAGADGHLNTAIKAKIPLDMIEGHEPVPAMEGGYVKGTPITQPIEVSRNPSSGKYTLYAGNHRVAQAALNGESSVPAFIEGATKEDLDAFDDITLKPHRFSNSAKIRQQILEQAKGNQ